MLSISQGDYVSSHRLSHGLSRITNDSKQQSRFELESRTITPQTRFMHRCFRCWMAGQYMHSRDDLLLYAGSTVLHGLAHCLLGVNQNQKYPQCSQYLGLGWCCTEELVKLHPRTTSTLTNQQRRLLRRPSLLIVRPARSRKLHRAGTRHRKGLLSAVHHLRQRLRRIGIFRAVQHPRNQI